MTYALGIIANILILVGFGFFFRSIWKGQTTPNPTTWLISALLTALNAVSYVLLVQDIQKSFIAILVALLANGVLIYSFRNRKFSKFGKSEALFLGSALIIIIVWLITESAGIASALIQLVYCISYIPTIIALYKKTSRENYLPWLIVSVSYIFVTAQLLINFNGDYLSLLYPVFNGIIGNGAVALFGIISNPNSSTNTD